MDILKQKEELQRQMDELKKKEALIAEEAKAWEDAKKNADEIIRNQKAKNNYILGKVSESKKYKGKITVETETKTGQVRAYMYVNGERRELGYYDYIDEIVTAKYRNHEIYVRTGSSGYYSWSKGNLYISHESYSGRRYQKIDTVCKNIDDKIEEKEYQDKLKSEKATAMAMAKADLKKQFPSAKFESYSYKNALEVIFKNGNEITYTVRPDSESGYSLYIVRVTDKGYRKSQEDNIAFAKYLNDQTHDKK